jgi:hypothetical protein
MLPKS